MSISPARPLVAALICAALAPVAVAADAEDPIDGLKCFIMKRKDVTEKYAVDWKEGTLYLCCKSCIKRVDRYPERYEPQANHQLLQTKQYEQNACPISGEAISDDSPTFEIGGVVVKFSSEAHRDEIAGLDSEKEQMIRLFGPEGFDTGKFAPVPEEDA